MQHLLGLGHQRIAFLGTTHCSDFIERHDAYRAALTESGIAVDAELELIHDAYLYGTEELKAPILTLLNFAEIGRLGVESLLLLLEGGAVNEGRRTVPIQLVIRNTTGPAHPGSCTGVMR